MDPTRFDTFAKRVAATPSRRGLLQALVGAVSGGLLAGGGAARARANKGGIPNHGHSDCLDPGATCTATGEGGGSACCFGPCCAMDTGPVCCKHHEVCAHFHEGGISTGPYPVCCPTASICSAGARGTMCCGPDQPCVPGYGCCRGGSLPTGAACASGADCCTGICQGGTCCSEAYCAGDADCCPGQTCQDGFCRTCATLSNACRVDADCCSGTCGPNGTCCAATNDFCGSDSDCCGGACVRGFCAAPCGLAGASCASGTDCCSGTCQQGRCTTVQPPG